MHHSSASFSILNPQLSQNAFTGIIPSATDEVLKLRKELRSKEAEFGKEKAILAQKVELLELQLKDSIEREESQRRMHETMINCLKKDDSRMSNVQDSQTAAERAAQQEIIELREQKRRFIEEHDIREKELKKHLSDKDQMIKELQQQLEKLVSDKRQVQYKFESDLKDYQAKIQIITSERDQIAEKTELKNQTKVNQMSMEVEKLKLEHQREMEKIKSEYDGSLKEIKYFHESEKNNLEHRVERSTNELRSILSHNHLQQQNDHQISQRKDQLEKEIDYMHTEVENIKSEYENQIELMRQEKELSEQKSKKLQKQLEKIKSAPKPIKIDLVSTEQEGSLQKQNKNLQSEVLQLQSENEKLSDSIKKLRRELLDNQDYIEKIEQNERKLRTMLKERESDLDSEKIDLKKQLNQEKKKSIEVKESNNKLRDSFEKSKNKNLSDLLEKDEKIIKLTRELRECEKKLSESCKNNRNQSPFNVEQPQNHNRTISYSPLGHQQQQMQQNFAFPMGVNTSNISNLGCNIQISPRGSYQQFAPQQMDKQPMKQISQLEFTLLKTCQRMADSASRMECSFCYMTFDTSDFYDHLMQDHPISNKPITASQQLNHQSSISISGSGFQSNKALAKRNFIEDSNTKITESISPKSALQQMNPKFHQNSRSFTCLLNEIEEEEKISIDSHLQTNDVLLRKMKEHQKASQHSSKQSKDKKSENEFKRSRNTNNSTVLIGNTNSTIGGSGNTISSVLKSQKQLTKKALEQTNKHLNSTISPAPQTTSVNTACRTEIQNLKKQNKKLSNQLLNQETKIQDISRDCSQLKKKAIKEETQNQSKLTNEIKGLLEKLVSYQGVPNQQQTNKKESGALTSRQYNNMPMSTESIVHLRSSTSMSSLNGKQQQPANQRQFRNQSKSPIDTQNLTARNHASNKENQNQQLKNRKQSVQVPHLKCLPQSMIEENHISSGEDNRHFHHNQHFHQNSCSSKCQTERRFNDSGSNCTNSPNRYQHYFEILQSIPSGVQEKTSNNQRYSPTQESTQKLNSYRQHQMNQAKQDKGGQSRNNSNLPMVYNSKYTNNSSQHNLVLYDSTNTDMFKSKNMFKYSCGKHQQNTHNNQGGHQIGNMRKLEYDEQCCCIEEDDQKMTSSSCPSLNDFEDTHQMMTEDPFVTGRFCQRGCDNGKQFVFKQSKNSTLKTLNFNQ